MDSYSSTNNSIRNDIIAYLYVLGSPKAIRLLTAEEQRIGLDASNVMGCLFRLYDSLAADSDQRSAVLLKKIKQREKANGAMAWSPFEEHTAWDRYHDNYYVIADFEAMTEQLGFLLIDYLRNECISDEEKNKFLNKFDQEFEKILKK